MPKGGIPKPKISNEKKFNRDTKKFFNVPLSEKSEMSHEWNQFYRPESSHAASRKDMNTNEEMQRFKNVRDSHRRTTTSLKTNENKQHFKRAAAKFYGENYVPSDQGSSMGSIFQENAAEFYGVAKPQHGERPFKFSKQGHNPDSVVKTSSVLNERRLKTHEFNMQRNPVFSKNLKKFYGLDSQRKFVR